jgi:hypothetical protein
METLIKNPYLRFSPPFEINLPPTKLERRVDEQSKGLKTRVPSYAHPKKLEKYCSFEAIFGERPGYLLQKKGNTSKLFGSRTALFWMSSERRVRTMKKQDGRNHQTFVPALASPNVTKAKKSSQLFQTKPGLPKMRTTRKPITIGKNEVMCVRHEQTGKILTTGNMIVPGVGVVKLEQDLHTAARTGRIFTKETNAVKLSADSFLTPKKFQRYLHGEPLPSNRGKALHKKTVPTVLFVDQRGPYRKTSVFAQYLRRNFSKEVPKFQPLARLK